MMKNVALAAVVLAACGNKSDAVDEYRTKSMMLEGKLELERLGRNAEIALNESDQLPIGKVGPVPAEACCKSADKKCAPNRDLWQHEVWRKLFFEPDMPHRFQFSYESTDGKTATATAIGDFDCDGKALTFKLEMTIGADGQLTTKLVEPKPSDD